MRRRKIKLSKLGGSCPGNGHGNVVKAILKGFLLGRARAMKGGRMEGKTRLVGTGGRGKVGFYFCWGCEARGLVPGVWNAAKCASLFCLRFCWRRGASPLTPPKGNDSPLETRNKVALVTAPSIFPLPPGWAWRFVRLPPWWNMRLRRWRTGASSPPHTH